MHNLPHIQILNSFSELKFNLGKKTLTDFLKGNPNPTITRNNLDNLKSYGILYQLKIPEIEDLIEKLTKHKYLETEEIQEKIKIIKITGKGKQEITQKQFNPNKIKTIQNIFSQETQITPQDQKLFQTFNFFLSKYNDEQKKAILSDQKHILCIAGAGSGKTTVLTKRIEFLCKFRGIHEQKILAITFTKKAKEEMQKRLTDLKITNARIETFNSFCEKTLLKHGQKIYSQNVRMLTFKDRINIIKNAIKKTASNFETLTEEYFSKKQLREKTKDELFFTFINDIFTIIDYYKNRQQQIEPFYEKEKNPTKKRIAKTIYSIAQETEKQLKEKGLRDFTDQITDTIKLFKTNPETIPQFQHILIDEFQDLNTIQFKLTKIIKTENLFAVGDPRQAIYGWRGSDLKYLLKFPQTYPDTQIINLKKNYRSHHQIVDFFNKSISHLGFINLESENKTPQNEPCVHLIENPTESLEKELICQAIKNSQTPPNETFILARTNKILENYAQELTKKEIKFTIKSEEEYKNKTEPKQNEIILATVHSIKGMEAKEIYLVNANSLSFPNKVQDNFIFSLIKENEEYDKETEELRLFYVAISRAKQKLIITYTGNPSKFIKTEMLEQTNYKTKNKSLLSFTTSKNLDTSNKTILKNLLKDWRAEKSRQTNLPLYMIISNTAIEEIATYLPQTKQELLQIKGLGDIKVAKYGNEILEIINGK